MISKAKLFINRLLPKSSFARGVSILVGGTASAQILFVFAAPLLTRLYTPADYGMLAVYASLLALFSVVASLRYELAIPLPEDDQGAANVTVLCLSLVALSSLLTGVLVAFLGGPLAAVLGVSRLADYFWLLPVGVLLSGVYTVFNYWGIRQKQFTTIAQTRLRQAVVTLIIQLSAFKLGGIALIFGQIAGQSVGTSNLATPALARPEFRNVTPEGIKVAAIRYQDFPKFSTWAGLINTAGQELPPILFAASFSAGAAGLYALAHRILTLPASLMGAAIAQVFFSQAADAHREGRLGDLYLKLQDTLIQVGLPPAVIIIVAGPELFSLIFSEPWREAGIFAQWLVLGIFGGFVVSPLSQVFTVLERQKAGLTLQAILFLGRLFGIAIGIWYESLILAVALYSLASVIGYTIYLVVGSIYADCRVSIAALSVGKAAIISLVLGMPILASFLIERREVFYIALFISAIAVIVRLTYVLRVSRL